MTKDDLFHLLQVRYGAKRANGQWVRIKCPTCIPHKATKAKRGVNLETLQTKCWICEEKITVKQLLDGIDLNGYVGTGRVSKPVPDHPQARKWPCLTYTPINLLEHDHPAIKFLFKDFLFDLDSYAERKVGFIDQEDAIDLVFEKEDGPNTKISTADAIVFPVFYESKMVGWQLRYVPGTPHGDRMGKLKYIHLFKKGNYLYNYDNAVNYEMVIAVEGIKKALKFPNGVATLGKGISEQQIQHLLKWKKITLLYDGEEKTQEQARDLANNIRASGRLCVNIDPRKYGFPSPDEMSEEIAQKIIFNEWSKQDGSRLT